eukprot:4050584-Amphidinium_carterae.1
MPSPYEIHAVPPFTDEVQNTARIAAVAAHTMGMCSTGSFNAHIGLGCDASTGFRPSYHAHALATH